MTEYEAVIGLETHIQLNTNTKIFCGCKADSWEAEPNSNICPVCSGLPGVLPVLNFRAVEKAIMLASAMNAEIALVSHFDRKNYFYPDLPKGYQITQFDKPVGVGGYLDFPMPDGSMCHIRIHKMHLEEDAGKTKNLNGNRLIDFNRCGVPLVEMVTEPDFHSSDEASQYLIRLRQILRWIGVSEADMEKGHLRCDANVSIRKMGSTILNPKTEIKNINSIDAVRNAINFEIERQIKEVSVGNKISSWTLDWDDETGTLKKMRSKETEADYRYLREPDLLPLVLSKEYINSVLLQMPELPLARRQRFIESFGLSLYDAEVLTSTIDLSSFFEQTLRSYEGDPKIVSNWIMNEVMRIINESGKNASELRITPQRLATVITAVDNGKVNTNTAKNLLWKVEKSDLDPIEIIEKEGLSQMDDSDVLIKIITQIIEDNPDEVMNYRNGKESLIGWFLGQVMRKTGGKADPQKTRQILLEKLKG